MGQTARLELKRDLFHCLGLVIPIGYLWLSKEIVLWGIALAMVLYIGSDLLRLFHKGFRVFFYRLVGELIKPREERNLIGSSYFLIGAMLSVLLFEKDAVIPALFVASVSDILASAVGSRWGKRRFTGSRSLEGSLAFFGSAFCLLAVLYPGPWYWSMAVAAATALVEAISFKVDDNLSIPLFTAFMLQLGL